MGYDEDPDSLFIWKQLYSLCYQWFYKLRRAKSVWWHGQVGERPGSERETRGRGGSLTVAHFPRRRKGFLLLNPHHKSDHTDVAPFKTSFLVPESLVFIVFFNISTLFSVGAGKRRLFKLHLLMLDELCFNKNVLVFGNVAAPTCRLLWKVDSVDQLQGRWHSLIGLGGKMHGVWDGRGLAWLAEVRDLADLSVKVLVLNGILSCI